MSNKQKYDLYNKDSLKLTEADLKSNEVANSSPELFKDSKKEKNKEMSNIKALLIVSMLIVMYALISALPTFLMMHFLGLSFWLTQAICVVLVPVIVFAFGLHKPASNKQKLKSKLLL